MFDTPFTFQEHLQMILDKTDKNQNFYKTFYLLSLVTHSKVTHYSLQSHFLWKIIRNLLLDATVTGDSLQNQSLHATYET